MCMCIFECAHVRLSVCADICMREHARKSILGRLFSRAISLVCFVLFCFFSCQTESSRLDGQQARESTCLHLLGLQDQISTPSFLCGARDQTQVLALPLSHLPNPTDNPLAHDKMVLPMFLPDPCTLRNPPQQVGMGNCPFHLSGCQTHSQMAPVWSVVMSALQGKDGV